MGYYQDSNPELQDCINNNNSCLLVSEHTFSHSYIHNFSSSTQSGVLNVSVEVISDVLVCGCTFQYVM